MTNLFLKLCDWLGPLLFKGKPLYYTLSGAVVGAAIERLASALQSQRATQGLVIVADLISAALFAMVGFFLTQGAREIERVDRLVEWKAENIRWDLAIKEAREPTSITSEILLQALNDLKNHQINEERQRYSKVVCAVIASMIFLCIALTSLWFGQKLVSQRSAIVIRYFHCEPCDIAIGETSNLSWVLDGATEAFLDGERVPVCGAKIVKPDQNTTYLLSAIDLDGKKVETSITVWVQEPSTPIPTSEPSPLPNPTDFSEATGTSEAVEP